MKLIRDKITDKIIKKLIYNLYSLGKTRYAKLWTYGEPKTNSPAVLDSALIIF